MHVFQQHLTSVSDPIPAFPSGESASLLLLFAPRQWLEDDQFLNRVREACPADVRMVGCSTAGEITTEGAFQDSASVTLLQFEHSEIELIVEQASSEYPAQDIGSRLAEAAKTKLPGLCCFLVFSDGLEVNGSNLVRGLSDSLTGVCPFVGGLAGDGTAFQKTVVASDFKRHDGAAVGVALRGSKLRVAHATASGWCPFGTFRQVTRSTSNVLQELDGKVALDVYASYLGDAAKDLPSSGLVYPLEIRSSADSPPVIRTLLGVNRDEGSITFAGDIPEGCTARLMSATSQQLVDGASQAGTAAAAILPDPAFALLISCMGRYTAMGSYTDLEVEGVKDSLPPDTVLAGFYTYGEIGPSEQDAFRYDLHNQTMTIALLKEES